MSGNVQQMVAESQFDELRICVERSFNKLRGRLNADTAQGWIGNSKALDRLLGQLVPPIETEPSSPESLLELISTIAIPASTTKFVAREKFVINTKRSAPVKISYVGDNFTEWFLGKTEGPISEQTLLFHKLCQFSLDDPIITELGGEAKTETTLTELYSLMEKQGKGEDGVLLTSVYANIFYIRDINGVLRTVYANWGGDGWDVNASPVGSPSRWGEGLRVFSRNSG